MEIGKALKSVVENVLTVVVAGLGCLIHLTLWGIAIILAVTLGSCALRACGSLLG